MCEICQKVNDLRYDITPGNGSRPVGRGELVVNVRDYGTNRAAIQRALDAAAGGGVALFPAGEYDLDGSTPFPAGGSGAFPVYGVRVPGGVRVVGEPGARIVEHVGYTERRVTFYLAGSGITVEGLTFENRYDMAGGSRPTSVMIGAGDTFDPAAPSVQDITIRGCRFIRAWHPVKFDYYLPGGTATARNITVEACTTTHEQTPDGNGNLSSGGYNFKSNYPPRVFDVRVTGCADENPSASAAVGYYGVSGGTITGNMLNGSGATAAGIQLENGADNITITGNTLTGHMNGVWVDDSTNVTVAANTIRNESGHADNKGVRVTWQGHNGDLDADTTGVIVTGNTLNNCGIICEPFSVAKGDNRLGGITITGNMVNLDGNNPHGVSVNQPATAVITGNTVTGAGVSSVRVTPATNTYLTVTGNITLRGAATGSVGFHLANGYAYRPIVVDNHFTNGLDSPVAVGGAITADTRFLSGAGSPEGAVPAGAGTLFVRTDGGTDTTLYVKETPSGSTGWAAK